MVSTVYCGLTPVPNSFQALARAIEEVLILMRIGPLFRSVPVRQLIMIRRQVSAYGALPRAYGAITLLDKANRFRHLSVTAFLIEVNPTSLTLQYKA